MRLISAPRIGPAPRRTRRIPLRAGDETGAPLVGAGREEYTPSTISEKEESSSLCTPVHAVRHPVEGIDHVAFVVVPATSPAMTMIESSQLETALAVKQTWLAGHRPAKRRRSPNGYARP